MTPAPPAPRLCDVCGNEIPPRVGRCPFCESTLHPSTTPRRRSPPAPAGARGAGAGGGSVRAGAGAPSPSRGVATINLKQGMPTVAEALRHLEHAVATHRTLGTRVLIVVHGYGSTGAGGAIRNAVRAQLRSLQAHGRARGVVNGEEYSEFEAAGRALIERHPGLQATFRSDRGNPGITLLEI